MTTMDGFMATLKPQSNGSLYRDWYTLAVDGWTMGCWVK